MRLNKKAMLAAVPSLIIACGILTWWLALLLAILAVLVVGGYLLETVAINFVANVLADFSRLREVLKRSLDRWSTNDARRTAESINRKVALQMASEQFVQKRLLRYIPPALRSAGR